MEFSFIHVSDIHLDRPFSGLSEYSWDDNLKDVYKNAIESAFNNVIDYAIGNKVDFVFIAGDTFDTCEQDFSSKLILKTGLERLRKSDICVYLICGNHDPLKSYSKNTFNYDDSKIKIIGLNTEEAAELVLRNRAGEDVGVLHALSFREENFSENPVKYLRKSEGGFNIALLHCDLNADEKSPYAPCTLTDLKSLNYDYYALGHIHVPRLFGNNIGYSGTIQGRNTKETGVHGIRYVKVKNNIIEENIFVPTDVIRFEDITIDISGAEDVTSAYGIIEEAIRERVSFNNDSAKVYLVRPYIVGCCSCFEEINDAFWGVLSERMNTNFLQRVYISRAECSITPKVDEAVLSEDTGISGEIYRVIGNQDIVNKEYLEVEGSLRALIDSCNFGEEDYEKFREGVRNRAKEECKNLCNIIYENNGADK